VGPLTKVTTVEAPQEEVVVEETVPEMRDTVHKTDAVVASDNKETNKALTTIPEIVKPLKEEEPKPKKSGFNSIYPDIDQGRKILCFFAPGCDHCKETIRELTAMKKADPNFPEIRIAFMDEEAELIPGFFEQAGQKYTYKILDIATFWTKLGTGRDTPGVFYYWNGNLIKEYNGINEKAFKKDEFKKLVQKTWTELK
jgi:thiol-disulfide isomerase/thioredoxin